MEAFSKINWIAVIVGTVASFLAGWAWYSPKLFGKKWAEGSRVELGKPGEMPVVAMVSQFVALFVLALVVGITETTQAIHTAIFAIIAVSLFVVSNGSFVKKTGAALAIDFFYIIVSGFLMILAQGIF